MNRGLMTKTIREVWLTTLLFGLALGCFEALLVAIFPSFFEEAAGQLWRMKFFQNIMKGLLGTEIGASFDPGLIRSFAWVHPIVLALLWTHEITYCSRMPAGEIDRGTIDTLLGLPVSRRGVFLCESVVWLGTGLAIVTMGLVGNRIGGYFVAPEFRGEPGQVFVVIANLYCLYLAVGGLAWLVSTLSDHRARAMGVTFSLVLGSFLLNFLAQFWGPAKSVSFLSVLSFYRPLLILRDSSWPWGDMLVLVAIAVIGWVSALFVFVRRDIRTI